MPDDDPVLSNLAHARLLPDQPGSLYATLLDPRRLHRLKAADSPFAAALKRAVERLDKE